MNKSDQINELAAALVRFQAAISAAPMKNKNPFIGNKYADLGTLIETAKPLLATNGLAVSQLPATVDGKMGLETVLMHSSGQWISNTTALPVDPAKGMTIAQVAGSTLTYLRRYAFAATLGMYADEDVDGNIPVEPEHTPHRAPAKPAEASAEKKAEPVADANEQAITRAKAYQVPAGLPLAGKTLGELMAMEGKIGRQMLAYLTGEHKSPEGRLFTPQSDDDKKMQNAAKFLFATIQ